MLFTDFGRDGPYVGQMHCAVHQAAIETTLPIIDLQFFGVQADRWTHVACVLGASEARLYVDGQLEASAAHEGNLVVVSFDWFIGANHPAGDENFSGLIDSYRVYREPLTGDELCWAAQP